MVRAYYTRRDGAGVVRTVESAAEAEKILQGGYNAMAVTLRDEDDEIVGERCRMVIDGVDRWWWTYDQDAFAP